MYAAIKSTTDRIAQSAYEVWLTGGDYEATIAKLSADANVTDWHSTVMQSLTQLINNGHLQSRLVRSDN